MKVLSKEQFEKFRKNDTAAVPMDRIPVDPIHFFDYGAPGMGAVLKVKVLSAG